MLFVFEHVLCLIIVYLFCVYFIMFVFSVMFLDNVFGI